MQKFQGLKNKIDIVVRSKVQIKHILIRRGFQINYSKIKIKLMKNQLKKYLKRRKNKEKVIIYLSPQIPRLILPQQIEKLFMDSLVPIRIRIAAIVAMAQIA